MGNYKDHMDLSLSKLSETYASGQVPSDVITNLYKSLTEIPGAFVLLFPLETLLDRCAKVCEIPKDKRGPLWGAPYAVKDNIDAASYPTTAACPDYKFVAKESAPCVRALEDAGALLVGKANMDQFASGLVGTRTPYGTAQCAFDARFVPGGSSSGSAALVGAGLLSFALGTDTAGSGRVPAMFNGCVGMKPTVGKVSTSGVVPACRSLDCVSVFASCVDDGAEVVRAISKEEGLLSDPTRRVPTPATTISVDSFRFAVPGQELLSFMGPGGSSVANEFASMFEDAIHRLESLGGKQVNINFSPFLEIASLLYGGAFVAERLSGIRQFLQKSSDTPLTIEDVKNDERLNPVIRTIFSGGVKYSAVDVYDDLKKLSELQAEARIELNKTDVLLVPTTPAHYTCEEIAAEENVESGDLKWSQNANLGRFTNFVNLLDMCGVAVPSATYIHPSPGEGEADLPRYTYLASSELSTNPTLPFGVTLLAQAWQDEWVWKVASRYHNATGVGCGPKQAPDAS